MNRKIVSGQLPVASAPMKSAVWFVKAIFALLPLCACAYYLLAYGRSSISTATGQFGLHFYPAYFNPEALKVWTGNLRQLAQSLPAGNSKYEIILWRERGERSRR